MIDPFAQLGFSKDDLIKLAKWEMPFGKYQHTRLIDLPEEYLFWFNKRSFPNGELGWLMALCLELKIEGLDSLIKPLKTTGGNKDQQKKVISSDIEVRALLNEEVQLFSQLVLSAYSSLEGFPSPKQQPGYYDLLSDLGIFSKNLSVRFLGAFSRNRELLGGVIYVGDMKEYGSGGIAPQIENASAIRFLVVNEDAQGMGIGEILTRACIKLAIEKQHSQVILHTIKVMEAAWGLYNSMGFKRSEDLDFFENGLQVYGFRLRL